MRLTLFVLSMFIVAVSGARALAPAPPELRAAVVVHSLRHYFAVTRKEPRPRPGKGVLHRHHEALARAYADGKMPELLDRLRRGMLW